MLEDYIPGLLVLVGFGWFLASFPSSQIQTFKKKSHGKDDNQVDGRQKRLLTRVVQPLYGTFKSKEIPIVGSIDSGQMIATSHDLGPQIVAKSKGHIPLISGKSR